ncbi:hypothetical protein ABZ686_00720 [Streptomyces sp. NPDC006992]|uniref:hypothetical protein n=1 Tax=Streptomyces sp. NPDC006992 TaxID=3155601 RepID=UPI0033EFD71E
MIDAHVCGMLKKALLEAIGSPGPLLNISPEASVWAGTGIGFQPWFFCPQKGVIDCPQKNVLGLYFIRSAIRSSLIGFRSILAGAILAEKGFHAASTAMYYTSSFHALDGLLASRGRALIQPARGQAQYRETPSSSLLEHATLPGDPKIICATISRTGSWSFEARKRSHVTRWAELKQLVSSKDSSFPRPLIEALAYASRCDPNEEIPLLLSRGVPALAGLRHQALYEGFGYDDDAFEAVVNRENAYQSSITRRTEVLRNLAIALLESSLEVADFYFAWCDEFDGDCRILNQRVALAAFYPAFESELIYPVGELEEYADRIQAITKRLNVSFNHS